MRVLVMGASGLIGRQLVPQLGEADHEVLVLSRGNRAIEASPVRHLLADRRDPQAWPRLSKAGSTR